LQAISPPAKKNQEQLLKNCLQKESRMLYVQSMSKASTKLARNPGRKKGGKNRFKGIVADAWTLQVNPSHLWRVLSGKRESKILMDRYRELKKQQRQAIQSKTCTA
jgi:hypothetical protein